MKPGKCSTYWLVIRKQLGLPKTMRFYDLRHFYATALAYSGASEEEIMSRMGHSTSTFTHQVYIELFEEQTLTVNANLTHWVQRLFSDKNTV